MIEELFIPRRLFAVDRVQTASACCFLGWDCDARKEWNHLLEREETGVEAEDVSDRLSIGGVCNYPSETERQAEQRQVVRVSSVDGVR